MVTLIVTTLGLFSLSRLPIDLMPEITFPAVTVSATYENASPQEVEELITKPIEQAVAAVPGVEKVFSSSTEGSSRVTVEFTWGTNLDEASNDIRDRLDRVLRRLPEEVDRPILFKFDTAAFPIMQLGVSSDLHMVRLKKLIDEQIAFRFERVPGVATASVFGGLTREIHVDLDYEKIKALGLGVDQFIALLKAENVTKPGGNIDRGHLNVAVRTKGQFQNLEEIGQLVIARGPGGAPVKLGDVAVIEDSWMRVTRITRINGRDGLMLAVYKQSGSNTMAVAKAVRQEMNKLNQEYSHLRLTPIFDSSTYIRQSVDTVSGSALYGGLLAILVILGFLQHFKSTLIIGTAIPVAIVATFMMMFLGGFTLNLMTLGALALGVGMLVDNSIVVLENIFRLRQEGLNPLPAAFKGIAEVSGAIAASTLTTLAVFVPTIFLPGLAGVMFREFSYTIVFSLTCSLIAALTLTPMMAARLTGGGRAGKEFGEMRYGRKQFAALEDAYKKYLAKALVRPGRVVKLTVAVLVVSLALVRFIGTEFMPKTDESDFRINLEMEVGTRVEVLAKVFETVEAVVEREVPEKTAMVARIGGGGPIGTPSQHTGQLRIKLKPIKERERSVFQIMDDLRPRLADLPGVTVRLRAEQSFLARGGSGGDTKIRLELRGHDLDKSRAIMEMMKTVVLAVPGVTDVESSLEDQGLEELIVIDRQRAADAKVTVSAIGAVLETALGGTTAGYYREEGQEYDIVVSFKNSEKLTPEEIMNLTVVNSEGRPVILANVARLQPGRSPQEITRQDQSRVASLSADYTGRSLGEVVADIEAALKTIPLPDDFSIQVAGEAEDQAETFGHLKVALLLSILLVYMVMACQFEQLKGPLVVMFSVPLALIGVIWIHALTGTTFNVNSFIGGIMLCGIVVNNAILLVDQTNMLRRAGSRGIAEALAEAGRRRLRPILMTTLTTVLGLVPLALGLGEGGESQAPLARTVIGGLISSTFITLFVVPVVYNLMKPGITIPEPPGAA